MDRGSTRLFKARTTTTLYFYRNACEWSPDKPYKSDMDEDEVLVKRTGSILNCYKADEYFDDPDHFDYDDQQLVTVFNDGMWILFENEEDLKTFWIEVIN